MGARNRTQQNLEIVRTDPIRGLLFVKGSVPGHKGAWLTVSDAIKLPRHESAPYPAAILETNTSQAVEEHAPAGLVDEGAVHEMPALPGDDEVAAIAAEQEAGASADTNETTNAPAGEQTPEDSGSSGESKEG
jgi:large subunit ribosomal protein L3